MEQQLRQENYPLRRRHMGLAGAIIVVAQVITQFFSSSHSNKNISEELQQIRADQEKYFVRKDELQIVSNKIDKLGRDVTEIKKTKFGLTKWPL